MQLKNATKTARTITLAPCGSAACGEESAEDCFCNDLTTYHIVETTEGKRGVKQRDVRLAGSVTILAGQTSEDLPEWVASIPVVKRALDGGQLRLVK